MSDYVERLDDLDLIRLAKALTDGKNHPTKTSMHIEAMADGLCRFRQPEISGRPWDEESLRSLFKDLSGIVADVYLELLARTDPKFTDADKLNNKLDGYEGEAGMNHSKPI